MNDDAPSRAELLSQLESLCQAWSNDAEKLSQTTGVEPTTLLRCKQDIEEAMVE